MKSFKYILFLIVLQGFVVNSCQKPARTNYWDEKASYDPDTWAPSNLVLSVNGLNSVTLTWEQSETVEGFVIERKAAEGSWEVLTRSVGGNQRQYVDEAVVLPAAHAYRVYAYVGRNTSSYVEESFVLPTVTSIEITNISSTTAASGGNINSDGGAAIKARGVVWSNSQNPTVTDNLGITSNGTGTGSFISNLTGLTPNTNYNIRAYATNGAGTHYGNELTFSTRDGLPVLTTADITAISSTSAISGGNITFNGGFSIIARGVVWSNMQNPTIPNNQGITNEGVGTGSFTSNIINLQAGTIYYVRAYAINSIGTQYGEQLSFTTIGEVTNPSTGKIWMDRNLGASRIAVSSNDAQSYGDLYQWGRLSDGHEKRNSGTTSILSDSDVPGHCNFITIEGSLYDWRNPQNDNLWQGVNGINNPCPPGFRVPTSAELDAELQTWSSFDINGAFSSPLKLPAVGYRSNSDGSIMFAGSVSCYWSSSIGLDYSSTRSYMLELYPEPNPVLITTPPRSQGASVRCIKD